MQKLPRAKTDNIVVQNLKDEVLIYNLTTNRAFCLNEASAKVFNHCDGETTFDELKQKSHLTDEVIYLALDGLKKENLLADEYVSPFAGLSRREVIRKIGLASMVVLPVISAIVAPTAASAASATCTTTPGSQGQGTCPNGQRCVNGSCSACIAAGQSLPGGCTVDTVARCCTRSCMISTGNCN